MKSRGEAGGEEPVHLHFLSERLDWMRLEVQGSVAVNMNLPTQGSFICFDDESCPERNRRMLCSCCLHEIILHKAEIKAK